jgi:hypothetical protein
MTLSLETAVRFCTADVVRGLATTGGARSGVASELPSIVPIAEAAWTQTPQKPSSCLTRITVMRSGMNSRLTINTLFTPLPIP